MQPWVRDKTIAGVLPELAEPRTLREHHKVGFNGTLAKWITEGVGTMWCAYAFAALSLVALPQAIKGGALPIVQWISQTFLQLVLLSVIMVGQQVISAASDERAAQTYLDAEAILHEQQQIQAHLAAQDAVLEHLATRLGVDLGSAANVPAADLPAANVPAADLPATDLPAKTPPDTTHPSNQART